MTGNNVNIGQGRYALRVVTDDAYPIRVTPTSSTTATTTFGTTALTGTTATPLGSQACVAVNVENPGTNSVDVLIGDAGAQPYRLTPGEALDIASTNVGQVYAKNVSATTQTISWAARVET